MTIKWDERTTTFNQRSRAAEKKQAELEVQKKRLYDLCENGTYTAEEFRERKQRIEQELATLRVSTSHITAPPQDVSEGLTEAKQAVFDLTRQWLTLPPELRKRFQKIVFPAGVYYHSDGSCRTSKMSRILELSQESDSKNGLKNESVTLPGIEPGLPP